jgi:endonuclease G
MGSIAGKEKLKLPTNKHTDKELSGSDWSADWNVNIGEWNEFDKNTSDGEPHLKAAAWYAGTANLSPSQIPDENGQTIYRRFGDFTSFPFSSWYVPDHTKANFKRDDGTDFDAPWEGIGTGWFYSALGGGSELRPYDVNGSKKSKEEIPFEEYLQSNRLPVNFDNTYTNDSIGTRLRGDYAVPTLFNGNFDAISFKSKSQNIPGWYSQNATQASLYQWHQIPSLINSGYLDTIGYDENQPNYTLVMGQQGIDRIVHNPFVVPD